MTMDVLLAFTAALPPRVDRRLEIDADGVVRYRTPWPEGAAPAGTFGYRLDDAELDTARRLAGALASLPVPDAPSELPQRTVLDTSVTASADGTTRTHRYGYVARADLAAELREADDFATALTERALDHPLAAVALTVSVQPPIPDRGQRGTLRFVFSNPGTESVTFTVDPASLQAVVGGVEWQLDGRSTLGLVGPTGTFIDGVLLPATLPPGASGTMAFLDAVPVPGAADSPHAEAGGTIELGSAGDAPTPFALRAS
jgi:hypothetical protein